MMEVNWKKSIIRFLTAQTISLFGSSLVQYAIIWYITLTTSSGGMLTISTLCGFLPQILISLFAGVWIDRYERKKLIIIADSMIAVATLCLALVYLAGYGNVWSLFVVLMIRSTGTGIQTPAVQAMIPQIVPKEYLMKVNGIQSTLTSLVMFLSPAISGVLLSIVSLEATLFVDVITAVIGVGLTAGIVVTSFEKKEMISKDMFAEIKKGFSYLKENPFVKRLLLFQVSVLFFISPTAFLTPLMVSRTFGSEVWRLPASEMTYSFGMVLGGLLIASWGGFPKRLNMTLLAGAFYGMLMIMLGLAPMFWMYLLCNAMIGITSPCYNAPITVSIQENVAPAMLGRVFSLMQIASSCALPAGMLVFGPLADIVKPQVLFIVAGIVVVLICLVAKSFSSKV